jgi:cytoskeleton protein RodZ
MVELRGSEIIGQRLRQQRESRRISLDQAATALHIRLRYVEAMDKGDFSVFPSPVQARGFLGSYLQYLGLDAEPFLAALDGDASLLEEEKLEQQEGLDLSAQPDQEHPADRESAGGLTYPSPEAGQDLERAVSPTGTVRTTPEARYPRTKFEEIGQALRQQRETLGLSLSDVENHTRLRAFYLKALESGDLDGLPSPVQGRGMLKNYANFLGMDADALLLQFAEGLQERLAARPGLRILKRSGRATPYTPVGSPQPRLITTDLMLAGVLVVFLVAFMAWGVIRISAMRTGKAPTATAPAIADVLAQAETPSGESSTGGDALTGGGNSFTATPKPSTAGGLQAAPGEGSTPIPSVTPPPGFASASVQVIISVSMRAWMRVTVDGKVEFEGRVLPGSAFPFAGNDRVEILTGNGAGLEVNFNQTNIGALGTFGEAVQRVFTVQGMQTPTPTITHTPAPVTVTPTLTPTQGQ